MQVRPAATEEGATGIEEREVTTDGQEGTIGECEGAGTIRADAEGAIDARQAAVMEGTMAGCVGGAFLLA